jgi:hypothetical protein
MAKATPPSDPQADHLTIGDMAMLIASRVRLPGEPIRATIDKVRKRLAHAVAKGELHTTGDQPPLFYAPRVVAWARSKWPGKLLDLPAEHAVRVNEQLNISERALGYAIPDELESCQVALASALRQIDALCKHLQKVHGEVERLRPLAEKYEANREKNRRSARLPRGGCG